MACSSARIHKFTSRTPSRSKQGTFFRSVREIPHINFIGYIDSFIMLYTEAVISKAVSRYSPMTGLFLLGTIPLSRGILVLDRVSKYRRQVQLSCMNRNFRLVRSIPMYLLMLVREVHQKPHSGLWTAEIVHTQPINAADVDAMPRVEGGGAHSPHQRDVGLSLPRMVIGAESKPPVRLMDTSNGVTSL